MLNLSFNEAIEKAEHLTALGQTTLYIRDDTDEFPYDKVTRVESGSSYRLNGPSSCYLIAEDSGLTFKLNVEFETRDANGRGVSMFDRDRLRELFVKLTPQAREAFAGMLERECLSGMAKRTNELRDALRSQSDSEDCVRGLISFARAEQVSA